MSKHCFSRIYIDVQNRTIHSENTVFFQNLSMRKIGPFAHKTDIKILRNFICFVSDWSNFAHRQGHNYIEANETNAL